MSKTKIIIPHEGVNEIPKGYKPLMTSEGKLVAIVPEGMTKKDFLDSIENQHLYQVLIKVDRLTLQIALMKIQGYSTREIAVYLDITEKAVYRRMDRLKEKLKKFFE